MTRWIHQLFRRTPAVPAIKSRNTRLDVQRLEDRETPAIFTVNNLLDNGSAGSLRWAIDQANATVAVDTVAFDEALNGATIPLNGTRLEVRRGINITGPSQGVTIDANLLSQVFYFDGRTNGSYDANVRNLTISRGNTGQIEETIDGIDSGTHGGGILNDNVNLTLNTVTVSDNRGYSAGISNWQGELSRLTITNSLFTNNSASGNAGAIYNNANATLTVVNTTFTGNAATRYGGAIVQNGGPMTLVNITATQNHADTLNASDGIGGFLQITSGTVLMHNSIVGGNDRSTTIVDDISFAGLSPSSSNNIILSSAFGLTNGVNGNQIGVNPLILPLSNNGGLTRTHALAQNSPALGAGSPLVAQFQPFDQRGTPRDNYTPDIGAYEVQHPLATVGGPTTLATLYAPKPSASADEAFVKGLYQSTLLRAPDAAGFSGWVGQLAAGTPRSTVANGFVNSTENRNNQVTFFYRYFLSREPEAAGLNGWVAILQGGTDEGQVMTGFVLSNEFSGQNNNNQFVNLMYYALLSRQADAAGFNGWVSAMANGLSRATVVNAFLRSEEGINRVMDSQFQTYLKRYATPGELAAFRTFLNTSTFGQAATVVLASAEFYSNAGNHLN